MNVLTRRTVSSSPRTERLSTRKVALYLLLAILFIGPLFVSYVPKAHSLVTINPSDTPPANASAPQFGSQNKVFYANGYWWVFWSSSVAATGIYYESSPDGKTWSTPTSFTSIGATAGGTQFDATLSGTTLYYVVAPKSAGTTFWFGAATLGAGTVTFTAKDFSHTITAGRYGTSNLRASIMLDGNNYLTVAVTTDNAASSPTVFYVDVFQCQTAIASCNPGTWYTKEYTLQTTVVADLTTPNLVALTSGSTKYDALMYDNALGTGPGVGFGPFLIYIGTSVAGSLGLPASFTCSPAGQFYHMTNFGAASLTNTVYVMDTYFGSSTLEFNCVAGSTAGTVAVENPIAANNAWISSLSVSGTTLVAVYTNGVNIQSFTSVSPYTTWNAGPNVAANTEVGSSSADISPVAYTIGSQTYMGVIWINNGNNVRFAALSLTNFAVSVTIALSEYQIPQTAVYPLNPSNGFTITYTMCTNAACTTTNPAATALYGSCSYAQGSCTTASPAYGCATGATAGCSMTIPNVESYTTVTIAAKTTGSTTTDEWCLTLGSTTAACSATPIGSSDGIPSTVTVGGTGSNNHLSFVYYELLANPSKYTVVPSSPSPPSVPTIHLISGPTGASSSLSPKTYDINQNLATTTYWIAANSTDFASASISGVASDQWSANPSNLAWTVTNPGQINPNIVYYHQFLNNFVINSGGAQMFDGSGSFVLLGTLYGQPAAIATFVPIGVSTFSADLWTDAATTVSFPAQATGTVVGARWQAAAGSTLVTPVLTTGVGVNPSGYSVTYWDQFQQSLAYSTNDGSIPLTRASITYTAYGVVAAHRLNLTINNDWLDAATTASVPQTIAGGTGERWNTQVFTWTVNQTNIVTNPSIEYFHQYSQQLVYSTSDHSLPLTVPRLTYQNFGVVTAHLLNTTVNVDWLDANTQATLPSFISGATGEQWSTLTTAWTINKLNSVTNPIVFIHQYLISFAVLAAGTGVVSPSGINIWESATSVANLVSPLSIFASPTPGYAFTVWTSNTPSITFASTSLASTTATLNGPGTITANFQIVSGLSFVETGITLDGVHPWTVTLLTHPVAYVGSNTITATTQAIIIAGAPLGTYTYTVPSPQAGGTSTQFLVTADGSGSVTLTTVSPSSSQPVTFQAQYFLTLTQNPANAGTVTANGSPLSAWFNSGTTVTLVATPNIGVAFLSWSGFACNPNCAAATNTIIMTAPVTATANFIVPLSITLNPPIETAGVGTQVSTTVTATGGSGSIGLTYGILPAGITVIFTSNNLVASATGATSTMIVTIAPNAPFGVYTWPVTATDSNGLTATTTFQLSIISPTVTTIGLTTSAYAITYGSQNALFFASGHWFIFYSDGTNLVYRSSTDATGTVWNVPANAEVVAGINQGYSFAVTSSGTVVYLVLLSPTFTGGFYYAQGTVTTGTGGLASIAWSACTATCALGPLSMTKLNTASGLTTAGSPNIFIDTSSFCATASPSGVCVWVTVPALDSSLMWHVEVAEFTNTWKIPGAVNSIGDVQLHQVYTGVDSQVHSELYVMPDAVAATFAVGNTAQLPSVTVFSHGYTTTSTFCVGGLLTGICPSSPVSWTGVRIYTQQQQGVVMPGLLGTDVIFFAALGTGGAGTANVQFYSFNYNSLVPALSTFSAPVTLGITTIPANAVVNHSWHLAMTFGGSSVYLAYGVDDDLAFQVGTVGLAPLYPVTWSTPIQVPGVAGLVGGVTISYSGNTVGLAWVQTAGVRQYAVKFAVI